jgi:hypothetical protein
MSGSQRTAAPMRVSGACHCGAVRLTAEVQPSRVFVCHCTDCQVLTGSAFRVVAPVVPATLKVEGAVKGYARTADSGAVRWQYFCPECGTPLYAGTLDGAGLATVRVGVLKERAFLKPTAQLWRRSALPWVDALDDVPACEQQELLG